jgi:hypothetical protein
LLDEKNFGVVGPVIKLRKPGGRDGGNAALAGKMATKPEETAPTGREPGDDT